MTRLKQPLTIVSLALATVGLVISLYLTYVHINPSALVCSGEGCSVVQQSKYSKMFGVPIAFFGVLLFLFLIGAVVLRELRQNLTDLLSTAILAVLVAAAIYWAYLTYLELNVIYAVCQWCVATSIASLLLLIVEGYRWYVGYTTMGVE